MRTEKNIDYQYSFYKKMGKYENICKDYHLLDELNLRKIRILKNYISDMMQYDGSVNYKLSKISKIKIKQSSRSKYVLKQSDKLFCFIFAFSNEKIKFLLLYFMVNIIRSARKLRKLF